MKAKPRSIRFDKDTDVRLAGFCEKYSTGAQDVVELAVKNLLDEIDAGSRIELSVGGLRLIAKEPAGGLRTAGKAIGKFLDSEVRVQKGRGVVIVPPNEAIHHPKKKGSGDQSSASA